MTVCLVPLRAMQQNNGTDLIPQRQKEEKEEYSVKVVAVVAGFELKIAQR